MNLVIDAQLFKGFYEETELNKQHSGALTASAKIVFERLGSHDIAFLDDKRMIENEWKSLVEPEWFDPWYAEMLNDRKALEINIGDCRDLLKKLQEEGFPNSKDRYYVKTAKSVKDQENECAILTEDVHFYDPRSTESTHRRKCICNCAGPIVKALKKHDINVMSLIYYNTNCC